MKITVAMPVHNAALSAVVAAYSILDNLFCCNAEWQLIIIDDNSDFESRRILETLAKEPGVRLFHTQNFIDKPSPNLGWNVNFALDKTTPEDDFFFHAESDIYLEPFCLRELINNIGDYAVATPQYFSVCKRLSTHSYPGCTPNIPIEQECSQSQTVAWAHLGCMLIKGDVARDKTIRIESDKFKLWYADFDYCGALKSKGYEIFYVPTAHARHRGNVSSHMAPGGVWPDALTPEEARAYVNSKWGNFD
jgi:glycosyltransferase involved in cell wall biosynthesis